MPKRKAPTPLATTKVLKRARTLLKDHWAQGAYYGSMPVDSDELPTMCLIGALCMAAGGAKRSAVTGHYYMSLNDDSERYRDASGIEAAMLEYVEGCIDRPEALLAASSRAVFECIADREEYYADIPDFNDNDDTTLNDVLAVVDCAIAKTEASA